MSSLKSGSNDISETAGEGVATSTPEVRSNTPGWQTDTPSLPTPDVNSMTPEALKRALVELQKKTVELESKNKELSEQQREINADRSRYFDLFESAPVAYLTMNDAGIIQNANLTASKLLGCDHSYIENRSFVLLIDPAHEEAFRQHCLRTMASTGPQCCELRILRNDGSTEWVRLTSRASTHVDNTVEIRITINDISLTNAPEKLDLENEQRLTFVIEASQDGIWDWNIQTNQVYFSDQWARLLGYAAEEIKQDVVSFYDVLHPEDRRRVEKQLEEHFAQLISEKKCEVRLRTKSGEYRWFLDRGKVVSRDAKGSPLRMVGTITDIHEQKLSERLRAESGDRMREREARLRKAQAISKIGNFYWDAATDKVEWSDELYRIYGREPETFSPSFSAYIESIHPDDRGMVLQSLQSAIETHGEFDHEYRVLLPDDQIIWVHAIGGVILDDMKRLAGLEGTCQDIDERHRAEDAKRQTQQRLQTIASRVSGVFYEFRLRPDRSTCFPFASSGIGDLFHVDASELTDDGTAIFSTVVPEDVDRLMQSIYESAENISPWKHEFRVRLDDGTEKWIWGSSLPIRESDGGTVWHGVLMDVSERHKVEEALRWSKSLLQMMSNSSPLAFLVVDNRTDSILYFNSRFCEIWGIEHLAERMHSGELSNKDIVPHCLKVLADVPSFAASCAPLQDEANRITIEDEIPFVDQRTIRRYSTQIRDESDRYFGRFYIFEDITLRKQADAERESLQAQLRESQKMEAVGTLAGGIAHDFNNILAVILGNAELASTLADHQPLLNNFLGEIRKAGIRARDLVQQILSFSRQRPTELVPISLFDVVHESASLLRATLPARLTLQVHCVSDLPFVLGDATQLEQVIINLATNSMQAIGGDSGKIEIRLDSIELDHRLADTSPALREMRSKTPGEILRLRVSDNGPGMNPVTAERIFEPFFTTKPVGKGTGLGLAVVHGIITAHHGAIVLDTAEGTGTRFTIYLQPLQSTDLTVGRVGQNAAIDGVTKSYSDPDRLHHILLIDDNEAVLTVARGLMEARGYKVSAFMNQKDALDAISTDPLAFDLVVTDYNMPGVSGLDVSRAIRELRPGLPVAVTSGFVDEELREHAEKAGVIDLISKPFESAELFRKIERMLSFAKSNWITSEYLPRP